MHITERFLAFTLLGAEWVLWLLIALSIISFAIMIERACYFLTHGVDVDSLASDLRRMLGKGAVADARSRVKSGDSAELTVISAGLDEVERGVDAVAEAMVGQKARERMRLERNLAFLGTLGNNAPFIGLFGTVLGIIKAFHDLSAHTSGGGAASARRSWPASPRRSSRPRSASWSPSRRSSAFNYFNRACARRSPTSTRSRTWSWRQLKRRGPTRRRRAKREG